MVPGKQWGFANIRATYSYPSSLSWRIASRHEDSHVRYGPSVVRHSWRGSRGVLYAIYHAIATKSR